MVALCAFCRPLSVIAAFLTLARRRARALLPFETSRHTHAARAANIDSDTSTKTHSSKTDSLSHYGTEIRATFDTARHRASFAVASRRRSGGISAVLLGARLWIIGLGHSDAHLCMPPSRPEQFTPTCLYVLQTAPRVDPFN